MDFEATAPLKFWMNQGRHATRRIETEARLEDAGICAERFPGVTVQPKFHKKLAVAAAEFCHIGQLKAPEEIPMRGYPSAALYVKALTQRLAIREAKKRGATAVLLLEDDWAIHPNFQTLLASLELPEDWAILHLGCVHYEKPAWVAARLVRVKQAGQSSGVIVRASHYQQVIQLLDRHGKKSVEPGSVNELVEWKENEEVPAYACYPNLLWRDAGILETHCVDGPHFTRDGKQVFHVAAVEHLLPELIEEEEETPLSIALHKQKPVKLGLLFLTRGDVHHVDIWREFVAEAPEQVAIYAHAKHPEQLVGGFLDGKVIADYHETAWGEISLVRATRSLLLKAMEDEEITHFALLSEACVPLRPLPEILRQFSRDPRSQFGFRPIKEATARQSARAKAAPEIPSGCWRFQSQWWVMNRVAATFAVGQDFTEIFEKMMVPDEAYFATVLAMQGFPLEGEVVRRDVTWTNWKKDAGSPREWTKVPLERVLEAVQCGALFGRKFLKDSDIGSYRLHVTGA
jgi:Core-2/I-Branching enzyme